MKEKTILILLIAFIMGIDFFILINLVSADPIGTTEGYDSLGLIEEWYTVCGDNLTLKWDKTQIIILPVINATSETNKYYFGRYLPSVLTWEAFPRCTNRFDMENYVNLSCIMDSCGQLIKYDALNGSIKTIWTREKDWLL